MTNVYIRAAIRLLERSDIKSAMFILGYILRVIENDDNIPYADAEEAGEILSNLN